MKKLIWRLSSLPTVDELRALVGDGMITQEEAKDILFNTETKEDRDKKSLQSEIKFLRDVVERLSSNNRSRIVEVIREIEKPVYIERPWYGSYQTWAVDTNTTLMGDTTNATQSFSEITTF